MSERNWDNPNDRSPRRQQPQRRDYDRRQYDNGSGGSRSTSYKRSENDSCKTKGSRRDCSTNYKYEEVIDIPSRSIGRIIGRKGSNIKRLQEEHGVKVDVDSHNALATVRSSSEFGLQNAVKAIKSQFNGNYTPRKEGNSCHQDETYAATQENYAEEARAESPTEPALIDWDEAHQRMREAEIRKIASLSSLKKDFYIEHCEVIQFTPDEVETIRKTNNDIQVSLAFGLNEEADDEASNPTIYDIPKPVTKFLHCFEPFPDILEQIMKMGFEKPSPIQAQAWPILLKGYDMIGIAQTGTGKTLAFLLPAIVHTEHQSTPRKDRKGPTVLVLAPTRELALQIEVEVNKYLFKGMRAVCIYGGGDRNDQISEMKRGAEIVIGTPGRLDDLVRADVLDMSAVSYLVLDEADRMLDMGFEPQIHKVLLNVRPDRQTVMTSATWPANVRRISQRYMKSPIQVCIGSLDLAATQSVEQIIHIVNEDFKYRIARKFVAAMKPKEKAIIFCSKKQRADDLSSEFALEGFKVTSIHGDRDQTAREQALVDIKSGLVNVLIATDVASRGLDIDDITHVINFDFPRNIEEYVHRIGRTGRAGRTGVSISYFTRDDWAQAKELIAILKDANQNVPEELENLAQRFTTMTAQRANRPKTYKIGQFHKY